MTDLRDTRDGQRSEATPEGEAAAAAGLPQRGHGLFEKLEMMRIRLHQEPNGIDYNRLSPSEKQAIQAMVEADEAQFKMFGERTFVYPKSRSWVTQFLSMGAHA